MSYYGSILAIFLSLCVLFVLFAKLYNMLYHQWRFGVPFIRTKNQGIDELVKQLDIYSGQTFLDLGCGDGIVMASVLEVNPQVMTRGYEIDPKVAVLGKQYEIKYEDRFQIINDDFFKADFSDADVIYCYLLPRYIMPIWKKIQKECKPGTILYSYVFEVKGVECVKKTIISIPGKKNDVLYMYMV